MYEFFFAWILFFSQQTSSLGMMEGPPMTFVPIEQQFVIPHIEASASAAIDTESGVFLWEDQKEKQLPMASLTKMMTALVILKNHDMDEQVVVSKEVVQKAEGARVWLYAGDSFSVRELLYALLIRSANDVALAFATFDAGSEEAFVKKMNAEAKILGLKNTHFQNAWGGDEEMHYSSVEDLLRLSERILKFPLVRTIIQKKEATIVSDSGRQLSFSTTNKLLEEGLVLGVKTGTTPMAGECFVGLVKTQSGRDVLIAVLGSKMRWTETKSIFSSIKKRYKL